MGAGLLDNLPLQWQHCWDDIFDVWQRVKHFRLFCASIMMLASLLICMCIRLTQLIRRHFGYVEAAYNYTRCWQQKCIARKTDSQQHVSSWCSMHPAPNGVASFCSFRFEVWVCKDLVGWRVNFGIPLSHRIIRSIPDQVWMMDNFWMQRLFWQVFYDIETFQNGYLIPVFRSPVYGWWTKLSNTMVRLLFRVRFCFFRKCDFPEALVKNLPIW